MDTQVDFRAAEIKSPQGHEVMLINGDAEVEANATQDHEQNARARLRYTLTQIPPIPVTVFVALQHALTSVASALTLASVIGETLCAEPGHPIRSRLFSASLFMSGLATLVQTTIGLRLPVFQGASSTFLVPLIALTSNPQWTCSQPASHEGGQPNTTSSGEWSHIPGHTALNLEQKLKLLSGSLMVASLLEVVVGGAGLLRPLLRYIGPLTVAPTIALVGLSLYKLPVVYAKDNPALALGTVTVTVIFSLFLNKLQMPLPSCSKDKQPHRFPVFQLLPVLLAMLLMWFLCWVLTLTNVFPDDVSSQYYYSRTDARNNIIKGTPWFQLTYPGQFGVPAVSLAATVGFLAAVVANVVESVGDYLATARVCHVLTPPYHAMSRGILVEGLASLMSGAVGAAHATTSFTHNIALMSLTETVSRIVMVVTGAMLIVMSVIGKLGAALATMPGPILGGVYVVVMGMLAALGLGNLAYVDMASNRNLLVLGVSFMAGLSVPVYVEQHGHALRTGNESFDQVIQVILGTPMFLGGVIAFILDNTAPGTEEERGLKAWRGPLSTVPASDKPQVHIPDDKEMNGEGPESLLHTEDQENTQRNTGICGETAKLTEDEIYAFGLLKGRCSSRFWRFIMFLPPNMVKKPDAY